MSKKFNKIFAMLLALTMVCSLVPAATAHAEGYTYSWKEDWDITSHLFDEETCPAAIAVGYNYANEAVIANPENYGCIWENDELKCEHGFVLCTRTIDPLADVKADVTNFTGECIFIYDNNSFTVTVVGRTNVLSYLNGLTDVTADKYTDNSWAVYNGDYSIDLDVCFYEEHEFEDGVCTYCGAKESTEVCQYLDASNPRQGGHLYVYGGDTLVYEPKDGVLKYLGRYGEEVLPETGWWHFTGSTYIYCEEQGEGSHPIMVKVESVSLDKTSVTLEVNATETLTATINPSNATDQTVTWSSSNPNVATVENGVVTAVAPGITFIYVTTTDGEETARCYVAVPITAPASAPAGEDLSEYECTAHEGISHFYSYGIPAGGPSGGTIVSGIYYDEDGIIVCAPQTGSYFSPNRFPEGSTEGWYYYNEEAVAYTPCDGVHGPHTHSFTYTAKDDTVTAKCTVEGCPLTESRTAVKVSANGAKFKTDALSVLKAVNDEEYLIAEADNDKSFEVVLSAESITPSAVDKELIAKKLGSYTVGQYLDLKMSLNCNGEFVHAYTELAAPVSVAVEIPSELIQTDTKLFRTYKVIRIHEGVAEVLGASFDKTSKTLSFSTDRFSTYAIVYVDSNNPQTGDSNDLTMSFAMLILCGLGITATAAVLPRKQRYNGKH